MKNCVLIRKEEIDKTLAAAPSFGKHHLEPLKSLLFSGKIPFGIMEDHEVSEMESEIHKNEADLWIVLEGEAEFIYGEQRKKAILKPGDILYIPANQLHAHRSSKTARMLIIKIPEK